MIWGAEDFDFLDKLCKGDAEAKAFIAGWARWCHGIDDVVDGDRDSAEDIIRAFAGSILLFSSPFYQRHTVHLAAIALNVAHKYADAARWEHSGVEWERRWADYLRHAGRDMMMAVAFIIGGYDHAREMSVLQWDLCRKQQHGEEASESPATHPARAGYQDEG